MANSIFTQYGMTQDHAERLEETFVKSKGSQLERKINWVKTRSPRQLLNMIFGRLDWNSPKRLHYPQNPIPDSAEVWNTHPFIIKKSEGNRLTNHGRKNLDTINRYYASIHGVREVQMGGTDKTGVINQAYLFKEVGYEYNTRPYKLGTTEYPSKTIRIIKPTDWREHIDEKAYATLPHKREDMRQDNMEAWKTNDDWMRV